MKLFTILDTRTGRTTGTYFGPGQKGEAKRERDRLNIQTADLLLDLRFCVTPGPDHPRAKERKD